jgi:hypothetical protein
MVGHVDDEGVVLEIQPPQPVEHYAYVLVKEVYRCVVRSDDALLLLRGEVAKYKRNLSGEIFSTPSTLCEMQRRSSFA